MSSGLHELGYEVIPFNPDIRRRMRDYIFDYIVDHGYHIVFGDDADIYDKAFNKGARVFPDQIGRETAEKIKQDPEIKELLKYTEIDLNRLCDYELSRNPSLTRDQYHIYWRFVRPLHNDVGQPHRDSQFIDVDKDREVHIVGGRSWKLWVPLAGCTVENSLRVVPKSHKMDVPMDFIDTVNGPKPTIKESWTAKQKFVCPFFPHELVDSYALLFDEDTVHNGPYNTEESFRISAEITIYVK
jgi:ectoine hydroxylase-related dioxygenase (phytanoyl-CoA dioxygenase family)